MIIQILMSGHRKSNKHNVRAPSVSLTGTKAITTELERIRQSEVVYKAKIRAVSELKSTIEGLIEVSRCNWPTFCEG